MKISDENNILGFLIHHQKTVINHEKSYIEKILTQNIITISIFKIEIQNCLSN